MNQSLAAVVGFALAGSVLHAEEPSYAFQSRLDDAAYAKALATLPQRRIDPQAVATSPFPTWGVQVRAVAPGLPADKAGITVGSIIDRINGQEYYYHAQGLEPDASGKREVSWVTPDGERHVFNFKPGRIGTSSGDGDLPEQYVFQNTPRGKWDASLLAASVAWKNSNPALAESALQRATADGLPPSVFTTYFGALFACEHGDRALARKLYDSLLKKLPAERKTISRFFHPGLKILALAFQDFDLLEAAVWERDKSKDGEETALIGKWKKWGKNTPRESLYNRAIANAGENTMGNVIPLKGDWGGEFQMMDPGPVRWDDYGNWIPPYHYDHRPFAPPVPTHDAIWDIRVAMGEGGNAESDRGPRLPFSDFTFALIDRNGTSAASVASPEERDARVIAGFSCYIYSNGEQTVRLSGGPAEGKIETPIPVPLLTRGELKGIENRRNGDRAYVDPADPHFIRITFIRLGDEAEILLNGQSIFHIPLDPKAGDLGFLVHSVGMSFVIGHMSLRPIYPAK